MIVFLALALIFQYHIARFGHPFQGKYGSIRWNQTSFCAVLILFDFRMSKKIEKK
jgi:hypothetical protein